MENNSTRNETHLLNESISVGNGSALSLRIHAYELLWAVDLSPGRGQGNAKRTQRLRQTLNRSFVLFEDDNRVTGEAVFRDDRAVAAQTRTHAPAVAAHLVAADRTLAETALADAYRVRRILRARNVSFDEELIAQELAEANTALERGNRLQNRTAPGAITAYRNAWLHAQRALEHMDWAARPNVIIETRQDFPHNETITYTVSGTVFDVRGHELDPLNLSLNGESRHVPLNVTTRPGTVATFTVNLTLPEERNRITVTATDPNRAYATHDEEELPAPESGDDVLRLDGDGLPDLYELHSLGTRPLVADSDTNRTTRNESGNGAIDGLEDFDRDYAATYDEYRSGTNPLANDTDGDSLFDGFELRYAGLNPLNSDTDNDAIPDGQEDRDHDGLANANEMEHGSHPFYPDTDSDELDDLAEVENDTDPVKPDTDEDGLLDGAEAPLGTDPTVADTDGDGVLDANETFTTATTNETMGVAVNVTGKGNVADSVSITNGSLETFAGSNASAAIVSSVVELHTPADFDSATLTFDYEDENVPSGDESALAVYRYDPTLQTFVKLDSSVDARENRVSADTPHFSTYTVLDSASWGGPAKTRADPEVTLDEEFGDLSGWQCTAGDCTATGGSAVIGEDLARTASIEGGFAISAVGQSSTGIIRIQCIPTPDGRCIPPRGGGDDDGGDSGDDDDDGGGGDGSDPICGPGSSIATADVGLLYIPCPPGYGDDGDDTGDDGNGGGGDGGDGSDGSDGGATPETIPPSELQKKVELPADAVEVTMRVEAAATVRGDDGSALLSVVTESGTETLIDLNGPDGKEVVQSISRTIDLSAHVGETIAVRARTENESSIEIDHISIEIERDSDGDGLTNGLERLGIRTGTDDRLYTNPYSADSDGDGVGDGMEVGQRRTSLSLGGSYYLLNSDPTSVDTDGDGLGDYEETYESQPYAVTTSRNDTIDLLSETDPAKMGQYIDSGSAWSSPMLADSDFDGVSDREELVQRTNVAKPDSDGDGVSDHVELQAGMDPTLHDARGPSVSVRYAAFASVASTEFTGTEYRLIYVVEDPSGVKRTTVVKEGKTKYGASWPADNLPTRTRRDAYFRTGFFETSIDSLTGTTVDITAEDRHGNGVRTVGLEQANFYGRAAGELGEESIFAPDVAKALGLVSGFASSLGSTADAIESFAEDPFGFLDALTEILEVLDNLGILDQLVEAFFQSFEAKQRQNNPYRQESALYDDFRYSWYAGYVTGFVAKAVVGASAAKLAKSTKYAQKIQDALGSTKVGTIYRAVNDPIDRGKARVGAKIVSGADRASAPMLAKARSGGATYRLWRLQRKVDACDGGFTIQSDGCGGEAFDELPESDQEQIAKILERTGDDGSYVLGRLNPDGQRRLANLVRRGEMDGRDIKAMARMLRGEQEYVDSSLSAEDLLDVGKKGDLSQTRLVVRDGSGRVRWLENERFSGYIWRKHAEHLRGQYDTVSTQDDILPVIYRAIKRSDSTTIETTPNPGGGVRYYVEVEEGRIPMRIAVSENGFMLNAFPDKNAQGMV